MCFSSPIATSAIVRQTLKEAYNSFLDTVGEHLKYQGKQPDGIRCICVDFSDITSQPLADLRGARHAPPPGSNFFFMQFLGGNWPNNRLALPPWVLFAPPLPEIPHKLTKAKAEYFKCYQQNQKLVYL